MKFRPCIDLHHGLVKQIVGGTLGNSDTALVENFIADKDAAFYARMYRADKLTGGHVIMLGPGNEAQALDALRAYPGGLQVGGGINPGNARAYLKAGATHIIVTSYVFREGRIDFANLGKLAAIAGKKRIVLDLSCRKQDNTYYVVTDRWQKFTSYTVSAENLALLADYCAEFLIHAADIEGKQQGIDEELVRQLGNWVSIPTTYAGGVRSLADMDIVNTLGQGKIDLTIGSALDIFGGSLPYRSVVDWKPPDTLTV